MSSSKALLVLGGGSDIGYAVAKAYAARNWRIVLAGRDAEALERNCRDLAIRGAVDARAVALDILATDANAFLDGLPFLPDTVICVVGLLGNQERAEREPEHARLILRTNFEAPALFLDAIAARMAARGNGAIVGVSSVAGDRGRASNYAYGSAKAGLTAFLSGLRNRLARQGVHVLTVKPGFVQTQMTMGMKLPSLITAKADEVGAAIYKAAEQSRRDVIYTRPVWRLIMGIIVHIPEAVFKKLKL